MRQDKTVISRFVLFKINIRLYINYVFWKESLLRNNSTRDILFFCNDEILAYIIKKLERLNFTSIIYLFLFYIYIQSIKRIKNLCTDTKWKIIQH